MGPHSLGLIHANIRRTLTDGDQGLSVVAQVFHQVLSATHRTDLSGLSDGETHDQIQYSSSQTSSPGPAGARRSATASGWNNDFNQRLMQVWYLHPRPDSEEPAPAKKTAEPGALWVCVSELGPYGPVSDQDMPNHARVQKGCASASTTFSTYQDSWIRHFHHVLSEYVDPKGEWNADALA